MPAQARGHGASIVRAHPPPTPPQHGRARARRAQLGRACRRRPRGACCQMTPRLGAAFRSSRVDGGHFGPNVTVCCHGVGPIEQRALASDHRVTTLLANAELFLQGRGPNEARPGCHPQVLRYISATICSIFDSHSGLTIPLTRLEAARSLPHFGI